MVAGSNVCMQGRYDRAKAPALNKLNFSDLSHTLFYTIVCDFQLSSSAGEEESTNHDHPAESSPSQQISQGAVIFFHIAHTMIARDMTMLQC